MSPSADPPNRGPDAKGPAVDPYARHLKPSSSLAPAVPDQHGVLQTDPRALAQFLDRWLALERPGARTTRRQGEPTKHEFQRQFLEAFPELAKSQASPAAFRTALELAAIWYSPRLDYRDYKSDHDRALLIRIASVLAWRREPRILEIYSALRAIAGDPVKLPWKILKPLTRLDGLDRKRLDGALLVPPIAETLTALPEIQKAFANLLRGLELVSEANQEISDIRERLLFEYGSRFRPRLTRILQSRRQNSEASRRRGTGPAIRSWTMRSLYASAGITR